MERHWRAGRAVPLSKNPVQRRRACWGKVGAPPRKGCRRIVVVAVGNAVALRFDTSFVAAVEVHQ